MDKRSYSIAAIAAIFLILTLVFYKVVKNEFECDPFSDNCIHLCSTDKKEFPDQLIKEVLKVPDSPWEFHWDEDDSVDEHKIVRGNLKCLQTKYFTRGDENNTLSEFEENFEFLFSLSYPEKYCIEFLRNIDGEIENKNRPWIIHRCDKNQTAQRIFHGFVIIFSIVFVTLILLIFASFRELKEFHGKCILFFLASLIMIFTFHPILHYEMEKVSGSVILFLAFECSYTFAFLWMSVFCYDSFSTLRLFKNTEYQCEDRLYLYIIFTISLTVFVGYIGFIEHSPSTAGWALNAKSMYIGRFNGVAKYLDRIETLLIILDIVLLIGAIIYAIKIPKEKSFDMDIRAKFETEKEWLWIRILLFFFTSITTLVELVSWRADNEYEVFLIADAMKLLCSFAIFIIFVTKSDIQSILIKKYDTMMSKSERLEFINSSA